MVFSIVQDKVFTLLEAKDKEENIARLEPQAPTREAGDTQPQHMEGSVRDAEPQERFGQLENS